MLKSFNWRCIFWLPSTRRDIFISVFLLGLVLGLSKLGLKPFLSDNFTSVRLDYARGGPLFVLLALSALNFSLISRLAAGDFISTKRLLRVVAATWIALSLLTSLTSVYADMMPPLSTAQYSDRWTAPLRMGIGGQLLLIVALGIGNIFKPSTNNASELRDSWKDASKILCALRERQDQNKIRQFENEKDTSDWDRLSAIFPKISATGDTLRLSLKCDRERKQSEALALHAKNLSAAISGVKPARNRIFSSVNPDIVSARVFFLSSCREAR